MKEQQKYLEDLVAAAQKPVPILSTFADKKKC